MNASKEPAQAETRMLASSPRIWNTVPSTIKPVVMESSYLPDLSVSASSTHDYTAAYIQTSPSPETRPAQPVPAGRTWSNNVQFSLLSAQNQAIYAQPRATNTSQWDPQHGYDTIRHQNDSVENVSAYPRTATGTTGPQTTNRPVSQTANRPASPTSILKRTHLRKPDRTPYPARLWSSKPQKILTCDSCRRRKVKCDGRRRKCQKRGISRIVAEES